jgi:hypothetical protein
MKTLQDVAKQYKKSAAQAIYPGFPYSGYQKTRSSKAFKTGNLLTQFVRANADDASIAIETKGGYEFTLMVAPPGAEYGRFVHFGTSKMQARPFAQIGAEDKKFRDVLDEFLKGELDQMMMKELSGISQQFKKAGFQIS